MINLRVSITKEVLEATKDCGIATKKLNENCAISYAIRQIWPYALVGNWYILPFRQLNSKMCYKQFRHYQESFIIRFDNNTPAERVAMQPFSFDIEVPDEVIGEVNIEEIKRICEGSKTLEVV